MVVAKGLFLLALCVIHQESDSPVRCIALYRSNLQAVVLWKRVLHVQHARAVKLVMSMKHSLHKTKLQIWSAFVYSDYHCYASAILVIARFDRTIDINS